MFALLTTFTTIHQSVHVSVTSKCAAVGRFSTSKNVSANANLRHALPGSTGVKQIANADALSLWLAVDQTLHGTIKLVNASALNLLQIPVTMTNIGITSAVSAAASHKLKGWKFLMAWSGTQEHARWFAFLKNVASANSGM